MGLIGWIKKEIELTSRQRRQSAPPPIAISLLSPNQNRDEAYMRAISKFNEWRNNQRFEKLNETKNASGFTQPPQNDQSILSDDFSIISDVMIDDGEKRRLIQMQRERKQQEVIRRHEHKAVLNSDSARNHRLSLPIMKGNPVDKPTRRKNRKSQIHPSNTIDEIEEFEQKHCLQPEKDYTFSYTSPPSKFYHENSEPYTESKRTPETKESAPVRKSLMGRNMLRRAKSNGKGKAPQPPVAESLVSSSNFYNGNFKHYEVNATSVYDEFLMASNAYKRNIRRQQPEKINSVGESSGSLSSDPDKKQRRLSPPYQTVINKHGDEVEYALPYNERDSLSHIPPLPNTSPPHQKEIAPSQFEQIINENFQFLNTLQFLNDGMDEMTSPLKENSPFVPVDASFSDIRRQDLQVTDLDKSNDTGLLVTPAQSSDIIRDLDTLTSWTKNLENCDRIIEISSAIDEYLAMQSKVKVFTSKEIKYKSGILRNSFSTPLVFSNGYFQTTPVTLRSTISNVHSINRFANTASKREFEILSQINHQSVAILMGISHDQDLGVMTLVMEPFDFTLNHYLHQMDQYFSIQKTITVVKQIASATQYLHNCGFVHSNISSHAVLIRESPFAVKLSSFELTTEILPRESLGNIFNPQKVVEEDHSMMMTTPADAALSEKYYKFSKQHFYNRNSLQNYRNVENEDDNDNDFRLPYTIAYRRMFSMHYYQPPELLIPSYDRNFKYVLPTTRSDTFALALLLWEALNHCVPFVIYNHDEQIQAFKQNAAKLPFLDKSSTAFVDIFHHFLCVNSGERGSDVYELIAMLDDIQRAGDGKVIARTPGIKSYNQMSLESKKNFKNAKLNEKLPEKVYFTGSNLNEADPQRRGENAITSENLAKLGQKDSSRFSESMKSSELEDMTSFNHAPGILLNDDALERIRKTVENQRIVAPKKPVRRIEESHDYMDATKHSLTDSTMYQSFFDFKHTPKIDKGGIYERTSTLKKRLKGPGIQGQKKSVKGLFDKPAPSKNIQDVFDKMNNELSQIVQDYNKNDFMNEIVQTLDERQDKGKDGEGLSSFLNRAMSSELQGQSRSFDELPSESTQKSRCEAKLKRSESDNVAKLSSCSYYMAENSLQKTPIASKNRIRRNAWLSDSMKPAGGRNSDFALKPNKSGGDANFINNSPRLGLPTTNRKQYNVSIKIHQNDLDSTPKRRSINMSPNDSSINIQMYSPEVNPNGSSLLKVNNVDLNSSKYSSDMNKKYYPMMPEMFSDVIQNKRDRSLPLLTSQNDDDHVVLRHFEQPKEDDNVFVPARTSVRDAVKFIESTFKPGTPQHVAIPCLKVESNTLNDKFSTSSAEKAHQTAVESQIEEFFTPTNDLSRPQSDDVSECLIQASESIHRLNEIFQATQPQSMPKIVNRRLESFVSQTPKKITTKVSVNFKKISRRSSDVGNVKQIQEQSSHSICTNAELIKRIQMHFKSKDSLLQAPRKNDAISASCSSLVPKDKESDLAQSQGKCSKYFCRNCGFTMLPTEILQKMQSTGRISISSSLAEGSQSMASLRKCHPISETKSTEDLYIDDDFCQGITNSLAANMELLPTPDFLDSIDFNFMTAEIFHTQEHEFDYTITDNNKLQLNWHENCDDNENDEVFDILRLNDADKCPANCDEANYTEEI